MIDKITQIINWFPEYYFKTDKGLLIQDDCFNQFKYIPNKSLDMILADLPYGTTKCKWDSVLPLNQLWKEYNRIIKDNAIIVLMSAEPFTSTLIQSNLSMFKYKWIWNKKYAGNFVTANKRPLNTFEEIVIFYKKQPIYNPQMIKRDKPISSGKRCHPKNRTGTDNNVLYNAPKKTYDFKHPTTIIDIPRKLGKGILHPTEKPTELLSYLLRTYTNENMIVLDNTAGVCSTGIACENLDRYWICIEKEKKYCDSAIDRFTKKEVS